MLFLKNISFLNIKTQCRNVVTISKLKESKCLFPILPEKIQNTKKNSQFNQNKNGTFSFQTKNIEEISRIRIKKFKTTHMLEICCP